MTRGLSWHLRWSVAGGSFGFLITVLWGVAFLALRLRSYNPEWLMLEGNLLHAVLRDSKQWVLPFLPAGVVSGAAAGCLVSFRPDSWLRATLIAGMAPVVGYALTTAVLFAAALPRWSGGYAAEQGMFVLMLLLGPVLGASAAPFWLLGAVVLFHWPIRRLSRRMRRPAVENQS